MKKKLYCFIKHNGLSMIGRQLSHWIINELEDDIKLETNYKILLNCYPVINYNAPLILINKERILANKKVILSNAVISIIVFEEFYQLPSKITEHYDDFLERMKYQTYIIN